MGKNIKIDMPLVTAIIPVYNGEHFLKKTIDSVLDQTYQNLEVIIIDDASTDSSREIINSYNDDRIVKIFQDKNVNISANINKAIKASKGKYCAMGAHDDIWHTEKIEKQVKYMEEHPQCGVCFTKCNIIDHNDGIINEHHALYEVFEKMENFERYEMIRRLIFNGNAFCGPSAMIRKDVIREIGLYRYSLLQLQDYDLWLRILRVSDVHIINEKLTDYRQDLLNKTNVSATSVYSINRTIHETYYVVDKYIFDMDNKLFKDIFERVFKNNNAETSAEILCEKVFLLKKLNNRFYLRRLMDLLESDITRKILIEKYKFTLNDFYELNGSYIYWEYGVFEEMKKMEASIQDYKKLAEKQQKLLASQEETIKRLKGNIL